MPLPVDPANHAVAPLQGLLDACNRLPLNYLRQYSRNENPLPKVDSFATITPAADPPKRQNLLPAVTLKKGDPSCENYLLV